VTGAWAIRDNGRPATGLIMLGDFDVAGQDDYQAMADIADFCERLARLIGVNFAEPAHPLDLVRLQHGKHLADHRALLHPLRPFNSGEGNLPRY
jgi:hypothetical protein